MSLDFDPDLAWTPTDLFPPLGSSEQVLVYRIVRQPLVQFGHSSFGLEEVEGESDLLFLERVELNVGCDVDVHVGDVMNRRV